MLIEDKLKYATEREKEAYKYRQEGLSFKKIGEQMDVCESRARQLFKSAERRIRTYETHYELHKKEMETFSQPLNMLISKGEGNILYELLYQRIKDIEKEYKIKFDLTNPFREVNKSKLPYEYFLIRDLYEKIAKILNKPHDLI